MKKKNAFTLAELIGVLIILGIIALLLVPTIDKSVKEFRKDAYKKQITGICTSFETWKGEHLSLLPVNEGDKVTIPLSTLKNGGYVDHDLKNPSTGKLFPNDMLIEITKKGKNYTCQVMENSGNGEDEYHNETPVVALIGSSTITLEVNSVYTELGVIARTSSGEIIPNEKVEITYYLNGKQVNTIDTSILNAEYKVIYKVEDRSYSVRLARTVLVRDTTPPVITVDGHTSDYVITMGPKETFEVPTGTAVDNIDEAVEVISSGNVIASIQGVYKIIYTAIDSSFNKATLTLTVVIADPTYSDYMTEAELVLAGHSISEYGIDSKTQYGYQEVTSWADEWNTTAPSDGYYKATTQYGYQDVSSWSNSWSTTMPSDGYYRTKNQYNLSYTNSSYGANQTGTLRSGSSATFTSGSPQAGCNESSATHSALSKTTLNLGGTYKVVTVTASSTTNFNRQYASTQQICVCAGSTCQNYSAATNPNQDGTISTTFTFNATGVTSVSCYGYGSTNVSKKTIDCSVTGWAPLNTTTGTTGWQDSNTTSLGTVTNTETRTVYAAPSTWGSSTGWRESTAYDKTTSRKPVTRTLYFDPLTWSEEKGWRDETAYTKTTSRKPLTRTLYRYRTN